MSQCDSHGTEQLFDVVSRTDFMIQFIKLIECEIGFGNRLAFAAGQVELGEALVHQLLSFACGRAREMRKNCGKFELISVEICYRCLKCC